MKMDGKEMKDHMAEMADEKDTSEQEGSSAEEAPDGNHEEWEVDSAVEALLRAEQIKKDPSLMKKVLEKADEKKKGLMSLDAMRAKANKMDLAGKG